jgi:hypothetical protein
MRNVPNSINHVFASPADLADFAKQYCEIRQTNRWKAIDFVKPVRKQLNTEGVNDLQQILESEFSILSGGEPIETDVERLERLEKQKEKQNQAKSVSTMKATGVKNMNKNLLAAKKAESLAKKLFKVAEAALIENTQDNSLRDAAWTALIKWQATVSARKSVEFLVSAESAA